MNDKTISVLNNLIETCKDGEIGFQTASEGVTHPAMKAAFLEYAQQRARFASDLQNEVRRLGGNPEDSGSMSGSLHRGWLNIKSAVTGKDDHAIAAEAERGEDAAKKAYEDALNETLTPAAREIVERQAAQVRQAHDHVRDLRDRQAVTH
jgi:uncharacterized protein (TIGR02284 family)